MDSRRHRRVLRGLRGENRQQEVRAADADADAEEERAEEKARGSHRQVSTMWAGMRAGVQQATDVVEGGEENEKEEEKEAADMRVRLAAADEAAGRALSYLQRLITHMHSETLTEMHGLHGPAAEGGAGMDGSGRGGGKLNPTSSRSGWVPAVTVNSSIHQEPAQKRNEDSNKYAALPDCFIAVVHALGQVGRVEQIHTDILAPLVESANASGILGQAADWRQGRARRSHQVLSSPWLWNAVVTAHLVLAYDVSNTADRNVTTLVQKMFETMGEVSGMHHLPAVSSIPRAVTDHGNVSSCSNSSDAAIDSDGCALVTIPVAARASTYALAAQAYAVAGQYLRAVEAIRFAILLLRRDGSRLLSRSGAKGSVEESPEDPIEVGLSIDFIFQALSAVFQLHAVGGGAGEAPTPVGVARDLDILAMFNLMCDGFMDGFGLDIWLHSSAIYSSSSYDSRDLSAQKGSVYTALTSAASGYRPTTASDKCFSGRTGIGSAGLQLRALVTAYTAVMKRVLRDQSQGQIQISVHAVRQTCHRMLRVLATGAETVSVINILAPVAHAAVYPHCEIFGIAEQGNAAVGEEGVQTAADVALQVLRDLQQVRARSGTAGAGVTLATTAVVAVAEGEETASFVLGNYACLLRALLADVERRPHTVPERSLEVVQYLVSQYGQLARHSCLQAQIKGHRPVLLDRHATEFNQTQQGIQNQSGKSNVIEKYNISAGASEGVDLGYLLELLMRIWARSGRPDAPRIVDSVFKTALSLPLPNGAALHPCCEEWHLLLMEVWMRSPLPKAPAKAEAVLSALARALQPTGRAPPARAFSLLARCWARATQTPAHRQDHLGGNAQTSPTVSSLSQSAPTTSSQQALQAQHKPYDRTSLPLRQDISRPRPRSGPRSLVRTFQSLRQVELQYTRCLEAGCTPEPSLYRSLLTAWCGEGSADSIRKAEALLQSAALHTCPDGPGLSPTAIAPDKVDVALDEINSYQHFDESTIYSPSLSSKSIHPSVYSMLAKAWGVHSMPISSLAGSTTVDSQSVSAPTAASDQVADPVARAESFLHRLKLRGARGQQLYIAYNLLIAAHTHRNQLCTSSTLRGGEGRRQTSVSEAEALFCAALDAQALDEQALQNQQQRSYSSSSHRPQLLPRLDVVSVNLLLDCLASSVSSGKSHLGVFFPSLSSPSSDSTDRVRASAAPSVTSITSLIPSFSTAACEAYEALTPPRNVPELFARCDEVLDMAYRQAGIVPNDFTFQTLLRIWTQHGSGSDGGSEAVLQRAVPMFNTLIGAARGDSIAGAGMYPGSAIQSSSGLGGAASVVAHTHTRLTPMRRQSYCALIEALSGPAHSPRMAHTLLLRLLALGEVPAQRVYAQMVRGTAAVRLTGLCDETFKLMLRSGHRPDRASCRALLQTLAASGRPDAAKRATEAFERIIALPSSTSPPFSTSASPSAPSSSAPLSLRRSMRTRRAHDLQNSDSRDSSDGSDGSFHRKLKSSQSSSTSAPISSSSSSTINAVTVVDESLVVPLLRAWARSPLPSAYTHAERTFERALRAGMRPSLELCNMLLHVYARCDQPERAESLLRRMQQKRGGGGDNEDGMLVVTSDSGSGQRLFPLEGVWPDRVSFNTAISAWARRRTHARVGSLHATARAFALFEQMKRLQRASADPQLLPDAFTYATLFTTLGSSSSRRAHYQAQKGSNTVAQGPGVARSKTTTFGSYRSGGGGVSRSSSSSVAPAILAEELFEEMLAADIQPDPKIWHTLLAVWSAPASAEVPLREQRAQAVLDR